MPIEDIKAGLGDYVSHSGTVVQDPNHDELTWGPLTNNIDASRPIIVLMQMWDETKPPPIYGEPGARHFMTIYGYAESASGTRSVFVSNTDAKPYSTSLGTSAKHRKIEIKSFRNGTYFRDISFLKGIHN